MKYCGAAEPSWPTHPILQTDEKIFVWYRSLQKITLQSFLYIFFNENENNDTKIIIRNISQNNLNEIFSSYRAALLLCELSVAE